MSLVIELTPAEQARLNAAAQREGLPPEEGVRKVVTERLPELLETPLPHRAINRVEPPFRQDLRLTGIQFHEDPTTPISSDDWPDAFEKLPVIGTHAAA